MERWRGLGLLPLVVLLGGSAQADTRAWGVPGGDRSRECIPVNVELWTAYLEGLDCQIIGWATLVECDRPLSAYLAKCPSGIFTFTRTEADCYYILGCKQRDRDARKQAVP